MSSPGNKRIKWLLNQNWDFFFKKAVRRPELIRQRQQTAERENDKNNNKNLHSCAPTKLELWPPELQLIFQDHGSTATDYFKCHCFFPPAEEA